MNNVFTQVDIVEIIKRINKLESTTKPLWGKMTVEQMLAHCNVAYEMVYEDKHQKPNFVLKFILKSLVKNKVVTDVPYPRSSNTAPQFIIKDTRDFKIEKDRLVNYINKTKQLGESYFDGKESHSFGVLTKNEWNNMFYKHLNHHLTQFGV